MLSKVVEPRAVGQGNVTVPVLWPVLVQPLKVKLCENGHHEMFWKTDGTRAARELLPLEEPKEAAKQPVAEEGPVNVLMEFPASTGWQHMVFRTVESGLSAANQDQSTDWEAILVGS